MVSLVCHILECGHVWPTGLGPFTSVVSFCKEHTALSSYLPMRHSQYMPGSFWAQHSEDK